MRDHSLLQWICIAACIVGCNRSSKNLASLPQKKEARSAESTDPALNAHRAALGLRTIDENWILYRSERSQDDWKIEKDGFLAKSIFKDESGDIIDEEDYYYSGGQFMDREGRGWERITVNYNYKSKEAILSYTGTNKAVEAVLSKFLMVLHGPSTNVPGVMEAVKRAAVGWPNGPK